MCDPCGRRIRNLGQLYQFKKAGTSKTASTPSKSSGKGDLGTPENVSPSWKKSCACASAAEEEMLRKIVKLVHRNPSGQVIARIPRDKESKALVRNIACEKWREASNVVLKHEEIAAEMKQGISKAV